MKKKPLSIKLIALAYLFAPLANIWQIAYINHWPWRGVRSVFYHFNTYEWCVLGMFPIVAFGIWRVAKSGYLLFLGFTAFLIIQNTYAYFASHQALSPYMVILFQLVTFGGVGFFVQKHIAAPYFNPQIRWWETNPRYKVKILAQARREQTILKGQLLDISDGGCFIEIKKKLSLGDLIWISVDYKEWHFTSQAQVMWVRQGHVTGYGFMFTSLEKTESKKLHLIIKDLKASLKKSIADGPQNDSILSA